MWIVMTSSAKPKGDWGHYRNVAMVQLTQHATAWGLMPSRIDDRDRRIHRVIHLGRHNVGKTKGCAYEVQLAFANERVKQLNSTDPIDAGELFTWGGSA